MHHDTYQIDKFSLQYFIDWDNKEDIYNENLIFDIYLLMTENLNPFSLDS